MSAAARAGGLHAAGGGRGVPPKVRRARGWRPQRPLTSVFAAAAGGRGWGGMQHPPARAASRPGLCHPPHCAPVWHCQRRPGVEAGVGEVRRKRGAVGWLDAKKKIRGYGGDKGTDVPTRPRLVNGRRQSGGEGKGKGNRQMQPRAGGTETNASEQGEGGGGGWGGRWEGVTRGRGGGGSMSGTSRVSGQRRQ